MDPFGIISAIFGNRGIVGSVTDILKGAGILKDPEMELKVQTALLEYDLKARAVETQVIESVNATMRAEASSQHWAQWLWRPVVGFTFSAVIVNNYILMPYFQKWVQPIVMPDGIWTAMLVVLGAAAATRGWEKVEEAKAKNGNKK